MLLLLKGDLLLATSPENAAEAGAIFKEILASEGHVGGKMIALQSATRLCTLEMKAGKMGEHCPRLAEIYESFTEGFDTADLLAARAVLDQWQG